MSTKAQPVNALNLVHRCPVCGAEDSLDSLIVQVINDDETRRLVADVLEHSLPIGGMVVRYLRLFKPAKQALRITTARKVLAELVPLLVQGWFARTGRTWQMSKEAWRDAFAEVFKAQERGTLQLPLTGNGYLLEVAMRQANAREGKAEAEGLQQARHQRPAATVAHVGPTSLADALEQARINQSIARMGKEKP